MNSGQVPLGKWAGMAEFQGRVIEVESDGEFEFIVEEFRSFGGLR